jgi:serine/threonine protein kinase
MSVASYIDMCPLDPTRSSSSRADKYERNKSAGLRSQYSSDTGYDSSANVPSLDDGREMVMKLCDFGMARVLNRSRVQSGSQANIVGGRGAVFTPLYAAPEVIMGYNTNEVCGVKQDVFSFGLIFFQLCTRQNNLYPKSMFSSRILDRVVTDGMRPEFPDGCEVSERDRALIQACWAQDPNDRPTFAHISEDLVERLSERLSLAQY